MTRPRPRNGHLGIFGAGMFAFGAAALFVLPAAFATTYIGGAAVVDAVHESGFPVRPKATHLPTPSAVKGVYMSQCVVGTPSFREALVAFVRETELNSVVIDIKDFTGYISFTTENPALKEAVSDECRASDMAAFIKMLHAHDIYVIGRITVFQDPRYTALHPEESVQSVARPGEPWRDHKGLSFVSVASQKFWEYIVELSKESYDLGFDEFNYDYVRWPSDGPMKDIVYPSVNRAEELEKFFVYLAKEVRPTGAVISAGLFGYTTVLTDDLGIGQILERALPYFDYIMPMVYPSHYNKGFAGLTNVNSDPYKVVYASMVGAVARAVATTTTLGAFTHMPITETVTIPAHDAIATSTEQKFTGLYSKPAYPVSKLRPWLQSFDYPVSYTPDMVAAQIKANEDAGLTSYLFWDPANKYTSLRKVLSVTVSSTTPGLDQ